jgi:hypothetical protein
MREKERTVPTLRGTTWSARDEIMVSPSKVKVNVPHEEWARMRKAIFVSRKKSSVISPGECAILTSY